MFKGMALSIFSGVIFFSACGKGSKDKSSPAPSATLVHIDTKDGTCAQTSVAALQALSLKPLEQTAAGACPDETEVGTQRARQYVQCPYTLENGLNVLVVVYEVTYSDFNKEYYDNKGADKADICEDWSNEIPEIAE